MRVVNRLLTKRVSIQPGGFVFLSRSIRARSSSISSGIRAGGVGALDDPFGR